MRLYVHTCIIERKNEALAKVVKCTSLVIHLYFNIRLHDLLVQSRGR